MPLLKETDYIRLILRAIERLRKAEMIYIRDCINQHILHSLENEGGHIRTDWNDPKAWEEHKVEPVKSNELKYWVRK
jgi:hypothetical protein